MLRKQITIPRKVTVTSHPHIVLLGTKSALQFLFADNQAAPRVSKPNRTQVTPVSVLRLHSGVCNTLHLAYSKPPAAQQRCGACRTPAAAWSPTSTPISELSITGT